VLAIRDAALALADSVAAIPDDQLQGSLGSLVYLSPTTRRLCLESTDLLADALAEAFIQADQTLAWPLAKAHGIALAWVNQSCIDDAGRRVAVGGGPPPSSLPTSSG
jgi:hypothetical protein